VAGSRIFSASRTTRRESTLFSGSFITNVEVGNPHRVTIVRGGPGGEESTVQARWLVDALEDLGHHGEVREEIPMTQLERLTRHSPLGDADQQVAEDARNHARVRIGRAGQRPARRLEQGLRAGRTLELV